MKYRESCSTWKEGTDLDTAFHLPSCGFRYVRDLLPIMPNRQPEVGNLVPGPGSTVSIRSDDYFGPSCSVLVNALICISIVFIAICTILLCRCVLVKRCRRPRFVLYGVTNCIY